MTPKAQKSEHINRCYLADISLDNPVTNGHTTTCDLLWSGLPIITLPITDNMPSRVAASICHALGVGNETVCTSYSDYTDRAIKYATPGFEQVPSNMPEHIAKRPFGNATLKALRWKIEQNRLSAPLFNTTQWVRDLEKGLIQANTQYLTQNGLISNIFVS